MKNFKKLRSYLNLTQDEIAKRISVKSEMVSKYETGLSAASFPTFLKLIDLFKISFDYLLLDENCNYPRNLRLLNFAKKLDDFSQPESRSHIEMTAKNFLKNIDKKNVEIEQDLIDIELSNNFNSNLKIMRNKRELSQNKLGDLTNISGPAIAMYEKNRFPSIEKLTKLSNSLNISIHALATGEKLIFNFTDGHFGRSMLLADRLLPLDEHKILITLMEAIIKNN